MDYTHTHKVYLVGSGPGDEQMLTRKGEALIRSCDCLVYDRLIPPELIKLAPVEAKKIYVGKAASNHAMKQEDINQLLVDLSKEYHCVVRLKGGDPYVFGRGGEEGDVLRQQNVPFEVIPGISSSIGGLAYAGIPITHRDYASSFHVLTGHFKDDSKDHDWSVVSKLQGTLVFLMSIANISYICQQLVKNGKSPSTPLAVVSNAASVDQRVYEATIATADTDLPLGEIASPALLVVGDVVKMRDTLNWYEELPLFGKRILVTRSSKQASRFSAKLKLLGAKVIELPMIDFENINDEALHTAIASLDLYTHLWFTSENAIHRFMTALFEAGKDIRALSHLKILAIGSQTSKWLKTYHIIPDYVPATFTQEGIITLMEDQLKATDHVLLPTATGARDTLANWVKTVCKLTSLYTYQTVPAKEPENLDDIRTLLGENINYITFTSGSTVNHFHDFVTKYDISINPEAKLASIGPITSTTLVSLGYTVDFEANPHTIDSLVNSICENGGK